MPLDAAVQSELPGYPQPEERDFRDSGIDSRLDITALQREEGEKSLYKVPSAVHSEL